MYVGLAAPAQAQAPSPGSPVAGLVLSIMAGNEGLIAWPASAALASDNAMLHDGTPRLAVPGRRAARAFVEASAASAAGGRAKKLAAEGWHVLRLVGIPTASPALRAEAENSAAAIAIRCFSSPLDPARPLPSPCLGPSRQRYTGWPAERMATHKPCGATLRLR